jgi:hypothetical protein
MRIVRSSLCWPLVLLALAPLSARAASLQGRWSSPLGELDVKQTPEGLSGLLKQASPTCPGLPAGSEVLRGEVLGETFSGELRFCLEGAQCQTDSSWLSAVLVVAPTSLAGAVERGNDACHAKGIAAAGGRGGAKPKVDARAKLDPAAVTSAQALIKSGAQLLGSDRPEAARGKFEAALKLAPLPEAWNGIGVTHYWRKSYDEALAAYRHAIAVDPDFGDAYYNMACVYAQQQHPDLAFKFLGLALHNRFHDLETLDADDDLRPLRTDPRYAALKRAVAGANPKH